jgi:hypothetical protein
MRKFRRDQRSGNARLLVLIAALVLTVVWAGSETKPRRGAPRGGGSKASGGVAIAATAPAAATVVDEATPEGWGADPFDPGPLSRAPETTGR